MSITVTLPTYTIGADAYDAIPSAAKGLGTKLFVIGGKTAMEKAMPAFENAIAGTDVEMVGSAWYGGECTHKNISARAAEAKAAGADIIVGMGGGKALDTAKGAGFELKLPVFTLPTIAATCAGTTALSVVYTDDHAFEEFYFYETPAKHCFINTDIIAHAPLKYLRAGLGDTMAKHYECVLSSRNDAVNHSSGLGINISNMCRDPMYLYGTDALKAVEEGRDTAALEQVILANIVSTGLVSYLVDEDYNGAIAHSVFYGLTTLPGFEEHNLHGDVVGYGILVQLAIDGKEEELHRLRRFFVSIGIPVSLADVDVPLDRDYLAGVIAETLRGSDMNHLAISVDADDIWRGMCEVEALKD